eukprot:546672-Hanusia_phi.AAC.2
MELYGPVSFSCFHDACILLLLTGASRRLPALFAGVKRRCYCTLGVITARLGNAGQVLVFSPSEKGLGSSERVQRYAVTIDKNLECRQDCMPVSHEALDRDLPLSCFPTSPWRDAIVLFPVDTTSVRSMGMTVVT